MHARGSRVEAVTITAVPLPSPETFQAPPALSNGHANPTQEETPDPLELSKYIQDLLASLDQQPPQPDDIAMAIDPKALLATLNEPLPFPPGFLVPQSTTSTPNVASQQYPFSEHNSAVNTVQPLSGTLAIDLARLPEGWQREADILNTNEHTTIDPSQLHSSNQVNGHQPYSSSLPSFGHHHRDKQDSPRQGGYDHSYQEYAAPVSMHDWSDSDSDEGAGEPDLSQDFLQQSYDGLAGVDDYSTELWQGSTNGMDFHDAENQDETLHPHANGDPESSSDSDIPAEALININTSRSQRSETPKDANGNQSSPHHRQPSYETEPPDTHQADYEPYGPVAPLSQTARLPYTSTRQPTFPNQSPRTAADIVSCRIRWLPDYIH